MRLTPPASTPRDFSHGPDELAYTVLLKQEDGRWFAEVLGWAESRTAGATREQALQNLRSRLEADLQDVEQSAGKTTEIVTLPLSQPKNPLMQFAGMFEQDPQFEQVLQQVADYRRELDAELR